MYLDFWLGGLGLAFVAVGYHLTMGKTFGFSGMWEKVLYRKETDELASAQRFSSDEDAFMAAMIAAAREDDDAGAGAMEAEATTESVSALDPDGWLGNVLFVAGVFAGGLIAAVTTDSFEWRMTLGQTHESFFGGGILMALVLLLGGVLVGFGTRMAGGCTSGHGLNGCGQLQISSILATVVFFGTGIGVSWLMEIVL